MEHNLMFRRYDEEAKEMKKMRTSFLALLLIGLLGFFVGSSHRFIGPCP